MVNRGEERVVGMRKGEVPRVCQEILGILERGRWNGEVKGGRKQRGKSKLL